MALDTDIVIIGAGPYALSLAAHLRARGLAYRIFGESMSFWRSMPVGVNLKSLAFATNIALPDRGHSFPEWCRRHGLEDFEPCTMQSFASYGLEMQRQFVPDLEEILVERLVSQTNGFSVTLTSGENIRCRRVVVCTGLSEMARIPQIFRESIPQVVQHTCRISDYRQFRGKTVAVIGGGSSAIEAGALVQEAGGVSEIFIRDEEAIFHDRSLRRRPLWQRVKAPITALGASRASWILQQFPMSVHALPIERRTRFVKSYLGPSSPWWIKDRVLGKVPIHLKNEVVGISHIGGRAHLKIKIETGSVKNVDVDCVILGTGYDVDVSRLSFIDPDILDRLDRVERSPALGINFDSSVPGLYFTGPLSFMCFGPLFRFVTGADVTARRLSSHLSKTTRQ